MKVERERNVYIDKLDFIYNVKKLKKEMEFNKDIETLIHKH